MIAMKHGCVALVLICSAAAAASPEQQAREILDAAGVKGGLVVHVGCGDGRLLNYLIQHKNVTGNGIEHNESRVASCIGKGLSVLQGDINEEILDYPDRTFDYVILSHLLMTVGLPAAGLV